MGAITWTHVEPDAWSGEEDGIHMGDIHSSQQHYELTNSVGTALGEFPTLQGAQRQLVADRRIPEPAQTPEGAGAARAPENVLDIDTVAADMARVRIDLQTVGFVRHVDRIFVALSGPTLHLAVETGQFFSMKDAVRCIRKTSDAWLAGRHTLAHGASDT